MSTVNEEAIARFTCQLLNHRWDWTLSRVSEVASELGWSSSGTVVAGPSVRQDWVNAEGWCWNTFAKDNWVYWISITFEQVRVGWPDTEAVYAKLVGVYTDVLRALCSSLGKPTVESVPTAPDFPRLHEASEMCMWRMPQFWLSLALFHPEPEMPMWMCLMLEPLSKYPAVVESLAT